MSMPIVFSEVPKVLEEKYKIKVSYHTLRYWVKKFTHLPKGVMIKPYVYRFYTEKQIEELAHELLNLYKQGKIHLHLKF